MRGLLDHEDEVRHRGRVDGAARARPHDQAELGDDAGALDVAHEHVAVGAERDDALLDPRPAGVVDPDHRRPDLGGEVHDLDHLLRHHLAERAAEDREVLAEDEHGAAVDRPVAGDDRVAPGPALVHPELRRAVADEGVELLERARVEQLLDPLARGQLALGVLLVHRLLGGGVDGLVAKLAQVGELLLVGLGKALAHGRGILGRARRRSSRLRARRRMRGSTTRASASTSAGSSSAPPAARSHAIVVSCGASAASEGCWRSSVSYEQVARMIREGSGIPSPPRPPGPGAVEVLARVQDPGADLVRDPGAEADAVAELLLGGELGALGVRELARRLGEQPLGEIELSDLVQPRGLADQLALAAPEADLDRERERVGGDGVGVSARAGDVLLERRRAAARRAEACPAPRRERVRRRSSSRRSQLSRGRTAASAARRAHREAPRGLPRPGSEPPAPRASIVTLVPKPFSASSSSIAASPSPAGRHSSASSGLAARDLDLGLRRAEQLGAPAPHQLVVVDELPELGRRLDQRSFGMGHPAHLRPSHPESCVLVVTRASGLPLHVARGEPR